MNMQSFAPVAVRDLFSREAKPQEVASLIRASLPAVRPERLQLILKDARDIPAVTCALTYQLALDVAGQLRGADKDIEAAVAPVRALRLEVNKMGLAWESDSRADVASEIQRLEGGANVWKRGEEQKARDEEARQIREHEKRQREEQQERDRIAQAEALRLEGEGKTEEASAVIEERAVEAASELSTPAMIVLPPPPPRVDGEVNTQPWKPVEERANKQLLIEAAAKNFEAFGQYVTFDWPAIRAAVRRMKNDASIPGIQVQQDSAVRAKAVR